MRSTCKKHGLTPPMDLIKTSIRFLKNLGLIKVFPFSG